MVSLSSRLLLLCGRCTRSPSAAEVSSARLTLRRRRGSAPTTAAALKNHYRVDYTVGDKSSLSGRAGGCSRIKDTHTTRFSMSLLPVKQQLGYDHAVLLVLFVLSDLGRLRCCHMPPTFNTFIGMQWMRPLAAPLQLNPFITPAPLTWCTDYNAS